MHMKILQLCHQGVSILFHLYHLIPGRTNAALFTLILFSFSQEKYTHSTGMLSLKEEQREILGNHTGSLCIGAFTLDRLS